MYHAEDFYLVAIMYNKLCLFCQNCLPPTAYSEGVLIVNSSITNN